MGSDLNSVPALEVDWFEYILQYLDDDSLSSVGHIRYDFQLQCDKARLRLFFLQLDIQSRSLSRCLTARVHLARPLRPDGFFPTTELRKKVPQLLKRLSQMAQPGDRMVVSGILPWMEHGDLCARAAAVRAVCKVGQKGDHVVLHAVLGRLRDPVLRGSAMAAAVEAISHLADREDPDVIAHIGKMIADPTPRVRYAGLWVLPSMIAKGDRYGIRTVLGCMDDKDDDVREIAMKSLGKLVLDTNHEAITRIIGGLQDKSIYVRKAAMESLPCGKLPMYVH